MGPGDHSGLVSNDCEASWGPLLANAAQQAGVTPVAVLQTGKDGIARVKRMNGADSCDDEHNSSLLLPTGRYAAVLTACSSSGSCVVGMGLRVFRASQCRKLLLEAA